MCTGYALGLDNVARITYIIALGVSRNVYKSATKFRPCSVLVPRVNVVYSGTRVGNMCRLRFRLIRATTIILAEY